jgi:transposase-like protein
MVACMNSHTSTELNDDATEPSGEHAVPRRRRWNWERKLEAIARWEASGLSRMAFCRQEGLCYGNFLNWLRQRTARSAAELRGAGGGGLLEVRLGDGMPEAAARMEVVAPNGWRVRLGDEFAEEALRRVLHVVGQC